MAACGCADEYIEQILISERLLLAVSSPWAVKLATGCY